MIVSSRLFLVLSTSSSSLGFLILSTDRSTLHLIDYALNGSLPKISR